MTLAAPVARDPSATAEFFNLDASNWDAIYDRADVFSRIHQLRRDRCLTWLAGAPARARVLEVGCGTGLLSTRLASLGHRVTATDAAAAMLERTRARAAALAVRVEVALADAHRLPFGDRAFDLVIALGVIPWLAAPGAALGEMARVLAPGGALVVNCDNRHRLPVLLDPRYSPATARARAAVRRLRSSPSRPATGADTIRHTPREFELELERAGLKPERASTLGFGPFTMMGRDLLPGRRGVAAHRVLQRLGDAGLPGLRSTGAQHLVLARRPAWPT